MSSTHPSEPLTTLALRALRRPQTGLAAVLAAVAPELEVDMLGAYLVPPTPGEVELLATGGRRATALGPPGRIPHRSEEMIRSLALEVAVTTRPPALAGAPPWSTVDHVSGIATLLSSHSSCVVIAGGERPFDDARLYEASAPVGLLVQAFVHDREIQALRREVHEMSQDRSLLAAGLQHDLRAPLTTILGSARTLKMRAARLTAEQRDDLLDCLLSQADRLNRMIDSALDRDAVDAPVRLRETEIKDLVERASAAGSMARAGEVVVESDEFTVVTDPDRLERAVLNLVDNALKYSPPDAPVHVIVENRTDDLVITVADNGPGVSPEVLPGLFGAYATNPARGDGTGLGLHSVRRLVEELGGRTDYARMQGWTRFAITIPKGQAGE